MFRTRTLGKSITVLALLLLTLGVYLSPTNAQEGQFSLVDDYMETRYDQTETVNLLANDTITGEFADWTVTVQPTRGNVSLQPNGEATYTPINSLYGYDSFTYGLVDSEGLVLATADVTVRVISPTTSGHYNDMYVVKGENQTGDIMPGDTLVYWLVYGNVGAVAAENAYVLEFVPEYTTFNAQLSSPGWSCYVDGQGRDVCRYDIGTLQPNFSQTIFFGVTLDENIPSDVTSLYNSTIVALYNPFMPNDPFFGDTNPDSNFRDLTTPIVHGEDEFEEELEDNGEVGGVETGPVTPPPSVLGESTGELADTGDPIYTLFFSLFATVVSGAGLFVRRFI